MLAGEPAPRGLDRGLARVAGHAEHVVRVASGHPSSATDGSLDRPHGPTMPAMRSRTARPDRRAHRRPASPAWRFAQAYRARAGYPHRHPPDHDPGSLGLAFETLASRPPASTSRLVDPGARRRARARGRPRPRLGIGPRPDAAERPDPPCDRDPCADDRRPRPRRQPARGAAADRRRVRRGRARAACERLLARPDVTAVGDPRPLDGRHRCAARRRRRATRRRGRRGLHARGPVPAHAPDLPPREAPASRAARLSARLADDPRLPAAARPHRPRRCPRRAPSSATRARSC